MDAQDLRIAIDGVELAATLTLPPRPAGLVVFVHGCDSNRFGPRNRHVAVILQQRGLATLAVDLLTAGEEEIDLLDATVRVDVDVLGERLVAATDSVLAAGTARGLPLGYFGGDAGGAAALVAAARRPSRVAAVVTRSARLELARGWTGALRAPTLFVVGGEDRAGLLQHQDVVARVAAPHRIEVVAGAGRRFEEPGALDEVGHRAAAWFLTHLAARAQPVAVAAAAG